MKCNVKILLIKLKLISQRFINFKQKQVKPVE